MKQIAKSERELFRKLANLDGKRKGLSQKQSEKAGHYLVDVVAVEIILGRKKSVMKLIQAKAEKKARAYMKKMKAGR